MQVYKFRDCLLNTVERRVVKEGKYLELTTRTFDLLQLLVERSCEVVTKDELLGKVWNGNFVEEGNLPVHIFKLRKSLGESNLERFIETVQGIGYRFVAPVELADGESWQLNLPDASRFPTGCASPGFRFDSIAVSLFENENNYPETYYIAERLTESFITSLSTVAALEVTASRSTVLRYKSKNAEAQTFTETLGVITDIAGAVKTVKVSLMVNVGGGGKFAIHLRPGRCLGDLFHYGSKIAFSGNERKFLLLSAGTVF